MARFNQHNSCGREFANPVKGLIIIFKLIPTADAVGY